MKSAILLLVAALLACAADEPGRDPFLCDGSGGAVNVGGSGPECASADDCTGPDNYCQHRDCTLGVCGTLFTPAGQEWADLLRGDCRNLICDGSGDYDLVLIEDPRDDENECTDDLCMNGDTIHYPVSVGTPCVIRNSDSITVGRCDPGGECTN